MWLSIGTQALNIVLDVILIVFLGQGVWAAAFTSCLAMALGSVGFVLGIFLSKPQAWHIITARSAVHIIKGALLPCISSRASVHFPAA